MTIYAPYNHDDYLRNPEKYRLFSLATVRGNIVNPDGTIKLQAGERVRVQWITSAPATLTDRVEPIYAVHRGDQWVADVYAFHLADFVL